MPECSATNCPVKISENISSRESWQELHSKFWLLRLSFLCGSLPGLRDETILHFSIEHVSCEVSSGKLLKIQRRVSTIMYQPSKEPCCRQHLLLNSVFEWSYFGNSNLSVEMLRDWLDWFCPLKIVRTFCNYNDSLQYCSFRILGVQPILHLSILPILQCTIIRRTKWRDSSKTEQPWKEACHRRRLLNFCLRTKLLKRLNLKTHPEWLATNWTNFVQWKWREHFKPRVLTTPTIILSR